MEDPWSNKKGDAEEGRLVSRGLVIWDVSSDHA